MIEELHISGLGVIEEATLQLSRGLTVVTGETGAGKTMLVQALQLLLGARADSSLVRAGAGEARVEARIHPVPPSAGEWVDGADELIVSREVPEDGRSRARIQGRLAPISALTEVLGASVEVHGQDEHVRLARPAVQRDLLDRYAGEPHARALAGYRRAFAALTEAREALASHEDDARERARTIDRLRYEVDEIDRVGLDPDTDRDLESAMQLLAHAEELELALREASAALGAEGAADPLGVAVAALRRVPVDDPGSRALRDRAEAVAAELSELARDCRHAAERIDGDPQRLEELRARDAAIRQLGRKYGGDVDDILAYADAARAELAALEADEADAAGLEQRVARLELDVAEQASALSSTRRAASERLAEVVCEHLRELGMPHARFTVDVAAGEPGPHGADRIEFLLAPNPGEPARPVHQAASGGERSRVALAVEVALADADDAAVLVFDEVDAGIGGATAMAVGRKLALLAASGGPGGSGRQVLCVTHLAQLAAHADVHHVAEKGIRDGRTVTTVRQLTTEDRVDEIARMMGGDPNEAARSHARDLLGRRAS